MELGQNVSTTRGKLGTLLDEPIHRLMEELSLNTAAKLANESVLDVTFVTTP